MTLGDVIREFRLAHNLTLRQFGIKAGLTCSDAMLSSYQTGAKYPTPQALLKIAKCIDRDYLELFDLMKKEKIQVYKNKYLERFYKKKE